MRIVYILKRDAIPNIVLNMLYKYTALQSSFSVNNIALVKGRPELLNLKQLIQYFVEHRHEVVVRRTEYLLRKAEERAHILEGLIIASDNIDEVIALIRASSNKPSLVVVTESPTSDERKKRIFDFIDDLLQKTGKIGEYDQKI